MAKTLLTQKIESALKVWHPANYGGYRVDSFRQGFDALEVPVECGSIKSGLVDFVRVQECFTSETKCGTCKLSMYRDEDRDLVMPSVRQWTQEVSCPKDIANWSFRNEPCTERFCRLYKTKHTYTIDTVITCVEIKVSVSNFHSDHGHNFVGHCNYYAMPLALYKKVKDEIPDGIGVLLYYQTKAGKAHDFNRGMKGRTLELLWEKFQSNSFFVYIHVFVTTWHLKYDIIDT